MNHQKSPKTGKNQPKFTNFYQKYRNFAKLNKKFVQKSPTFREKYQFLAKIHDKSPNLAYFLKNKRDFSAKSFSLLLLALRPRLFRFDKNSKNNAKFLPKTTKSRNFFPVSFKIVVTSTILSAISIMFSGFLVNNTFATSITLTIPGTLSLDVNPNTNSGYAKSSNGNIGIIADSPFGYSLSIKAKDTTNGNALMNGSNKLNSIAEALSEDTYKSSGTVNTWGYIPSKVNGTNNTNNTNIRPGPSTSGEAIETTSVANASTANNYTVALAAKVDKTLQAGSYKNTFVISAVANSVNYSITYNLESGSWDGISPQTGSTPENSVTLSNKTPTRTDYTFKGWCDTTVTSNGTTSPTCPEGHKYDVSGSYPLTNSTNTINLYAIWEQNGTSYSITYDGNGGTSSSLPSPNPQTGTTTSSSIKLSSTTPTRSGYEFVTWCTTNPGTAETCSGTKYSSGATYQLSSGTSITLYAVWLSFPTPVSKGSLGTMQSFSCSSKLPSIHNYGTVTDSRDNSTYTVAKLKDGKCWMVTNLKLQSYRLTSNDSDVSSGFSIPASTNDGFNYSDRTTAKVHIDTTYGGYYNYYTATAGTDPSSGEATSSICPKGWRLPTGKSGGDFETLTEKYGSGINSSIASIILRHAIVPGFVLSGYFGSGSADDQGSTGFYWSSSTNSSTAAPTMFLASNYVNPINGGVAKYRGNSIRCMSQQ